MDWPGGAADEFIVYIDGSSTKDQDKASWGLVILVLLDSVRYLFVVLYAKMAESGRVCAAADSSSASSELGVLVWALLRSIAAAADIPVKLSTDSSSAIGLSIVLS